MSIGTNALHVLYVGTGRDAVSELAAYTDAELSFLVSATGDVDVAITQLTRADIDCVVCEYPFPDAGIREFLRRIDDMDANIPVVVRTDEDLPVSEALYDDTSTPDDEVVRLAARVIAVADSPFDEEASGDSLLDESAVALLDETNAYVAHVERDGTIRMVNATAAEQVGVEQEAIVGHHLDEFLDESSAASLLERGRAALDTGIVQEFDGEADGRHYRGVFVPVSEECFEVVVRDVTAEKRTEQAFHEERAFLETVIDSIADVFFVLDLEFNLVRWNDRLNEVSGLDGTELTATDPLSFVVDDQREAARARFEEILAEGHVTAELDIDGHDGVVPYEITGSVVTDEDGSPRYVCCIGRDISARRETQRELDAVIDELERSNAELEQFAYVASHDLKEPLRMIRSYLQLLERRYGDEFDEDAQDFIAFATDGAHRMRRMIDDLLEYSRVGRTDGELEPVDCNQVLHVVQRNLEVTIEEAGATVEVGSLPTVMGDRNRLVQLFQNLVGNAIKHSGEGPTTVTVDANREGDRWILSVADDGVGIPADRIDRVFDLFYRSETRESTGIGLAISKKIVDYHGGDIWVESTVGEGATFYVALPAEVEGMSDT